MRTKQLDATGKDKLPCRYSPEELKQRVLQATDSVRAGKGYTIEEMKKYKP